MRSYPVTPFTVRCPVRSSRPSASTTASPSTASRVTPYFAHSRPPAFVAMLPPIDEIARLAGSGANQRPRGASASLRSPFSTPGSTTASSSASETSRMRFIRETSSTIAPGLAMAPPARPVPAPRGTTGVPVAWAMRITACTSSTDAACTTASGGVALRHPERSSRVASSAAGSVVTDAPRASWRRARTSVGIPPPYRCGHVRFPLVDVGARVRGWTHDAPARHPHEARPRRRRPARRPRVRRALPRHAGARRAVRRAVHHGRALDRHLLPPELPGRGAQAVERELLPHGRGRPRGRAPGVQALPARRGARLPRVGPARRPRRTGHAAHRRRRRRARGRPRPRRAASGTRRGT